MQGIPDLGWVDQFLRVAAGHQLATILKAILILMSGLSAIWLSEKIARGVSHVKKKRNGGTEYDQLAKQSMYLEDIRDTIREQRNDHAEQIVELRALAEGQRRHTENVVRYVAELKAASAAARMESSNEG